MFYRTNVKYVVVEIIPDKILPRVVKSFFTEATAKSYIEKIKKDCVEKGSNVPNLTIKFWEY